MHGLLNSVQPDLGMNAWLDAAWAQPPERFDAYCAGARIACRGWNLDARELPGVVLVHGFLAHGGWWDHVAPPKADRWGPGTRIPALIISPYAKKGVVDHTQYDTTSILRFITNRWNLPTLPGITERDSALAAHNQPELGDLTGALLQQ